MVAMLTGCKMYCVAYLLCSIAMRHRTYGERNFRISNLMEKCSDIESKGTLEVTGPWNGGPEPESYSRRKVRTSEPRTSEPRTSEPRTSETSDKVNLGQVNPETMDK